ncbi:MAG: hypothetical protein ACREA0_15745, partial [bacterium]
MRRCRTDEELERRLEAVLRQMSEGDVQAMTRASRFLLAEGVGGGNGALAGTARRQRALQTHSTPS